MCVWNNDIAILDFDEEARYTLFLSVTSRQNPYDTKTLITCLTTQRFTTNATPCMRILIMNTGVHTKDAAGYGLSTQLRNVGQCARLHAEQFLLKTSRNKSRNPGMCGKSGLLTWTIYMNKKYVFACISLGGHGVATRLVPREPLRFHRPTLQPTRCRTHHVKTDCRFRGSENTIRTGDPGYGVIEECCHPNVVVHLGTPSESQSQTAVVIVFHQHNLPNPYVGLFSLFFDIVALQPGFVFSSNIFHELLKGQYNIF